MCQGVICSLVKWRGGSTVLVGVGSHSELLAKNRKKLERLGWRDDTDNQGIISIESDFKGSYGAFSVESGDPNPDELERLRRAYNKCAGSASKLTAHVKKYGFNASLVELLSETGKDDYFARLKLLDDDHGARRKLLIDDYQVRRKLIWLKIFSQKKNRRF